MLKLDEIHAVLTFAVDILATQMSKATTADLFETIVGTDALVSKGVCDSATLTELRDLCKHANMRNMIAQFIADQHNTKLEN